MAKSTKPGTQAPTTKPKKSEKVPYPGLNIVDGKVTTPLESWPTDFDSKAHKPLKKEDFKDEGPFYDAMAERHERAAKKCRQLAQDARTLGNAQQRAQVKRLRAMQAAMAALAQELAAEGVDVSALTAGSLTAAE